MTFDTPDKKTASISSYYLDQHAPELTIEQQRILDDQWVKLQLAREGRPKVQCLDIRSGDLIHNTFSLEHIENIFKLGIVSGEIGTEKKEPIPEDGETFFCADFFVVPTEVSTLGKYLSYIQQRVRHGQMVRGRPEDYAAPKERNECIMLIFEGTSDSSEYTELLQRSSTQVEYEDSTLARDGFILRFPHEGDNHRAVLVGLPANHIKGIVLGGKITLRQVSRLFQLREEYGLNFRVYNFKGEEISNPNIV